VIATDNRGQQKLTGATGRWPFKKKCDCFNSHLGRISVECIFRFEFEKNSSDKQQNLPDVINVPPTQTYIHTHTHPDIHTYQQTRHSNLWQYQGKPITALWWTLLGCLAFLTSTWQISSRPQPFFVTVMVNWSILD